MKEIYITKIKKIIFLLFLSPTCKINHVNMQYIYVNMRLIYVYMQSKC